MKPDTLKQYIALRESLQKEKSELEARIREINEVLGVPDVSNFQPRRGRPPGSGGSKLGRPPLGTNPLSLREAVLKVTKDNPMTKHDILKSVLEMGYRFNTNNPLNSLGVILYGKNPRFRNDRGLFSPLDAGSAEAPADAKPARRGRKPMNAESRP